MSEDLEQRVENLENAVGGMLRRLKEWSDFWERHARQPTVENVRALTYELVEHLQRYCIET